MSTLRETKWSSYFDAVSSASLLNVHINITFMKDQAAAVAFETSASELGAEGTARCQRIVNQVIAHIRG